MSEEKWRRNAWWVQRWEEAAGRDLTKTELEIKGKLPSYLRGQTLVDKCRMLAKIRDLLAALPMQLFLSIILLLSAECAVYLEAMGLRDKLITCARTYPRQICNAWNKVQYRDRSYPYSAYLRFLSQDQLPLINNFSRFFNSVSQSHLSKNPLYTKLQVDAIAANLSAFNPLYPVIGLCLNNSFTYYIFSTDTNVFRAAPNLFCNNSHLKYIFDFPGSKIIGAQWSPDGEIIAILTRPVSMVTTTSPVTVNLAHYCSATGITRELTMSHKDQICVSYRFASPRLWSGDNTILTTDCFGTKFRQYTVDTNHGELTELLLAPTAHLQELTDIVSFFDKPSTIGPMSASPHYPEFTVLFLFSCSDHRSSCHSSVIFYNVKTSTPLKRFDLPGYLRSLTVTETRTLLYVEHPYQCFFSPRTNLSSHDIEYCKVGETPYPYQSEMGTTAHGSIHQIVNADLSYSRLEAGISTGHLIHTIDRRYKEMSGAKNALEHARCMLDTSFDRSLQSCEDYLLLCLSPLPTSPKQVLLRVDFLTETAQECSDGFVGYRRHGVTTISPCGYLTFQEYNNFWGKPQIHHSIFLPSGEAPVHYNCFSKMYFEKPRQLKKVYRQPVT
jgi:hypothetical protein